MSKKTTLLPITKWLSLVIALLITAVIFLPIWRIELKAPQYPEGLEMFIHADHLSGQIDIINGLNNYIGMRHIHEKDFVEFAVLPYFLGALALFGLLNIWVNKKWFLYTWAGIFFLFTIAAMVDFYLWLHNYGHNLDPTAPIKVPGMTYSPPLIGFKQLLNFQAYSIPDIGGWALVGAGVLLVFIIAKELGFLNSLPKKSKALSIIALFTTLTLSSCSNGPKPIHFGHDNCDHCVMTLVDERYGCELITDKGKAYKFDDLYCLQEFLKEGTVKSNNIRDIYYIDYSNPTKFVHASDAFLLQGGDIQSPMASGIAAFGDIDSLIKYQEIFKAEEILWEDYSNQ